MSAAEFSVYGHQVESFFGINGRTENSATIALGWTLSHCPQLAFAILENITGMAPSDGTALSVQVQRHGDDRGFTDIEIIVEGTLHLIIEAKKEWQIPTTKQLERYVPRFGASRNGCHIVSMSAASREYASSRLPGQVQGIPVVHRSWFDIHRLVKAQKVTSPSIKIWLAELEKHLKGYVSMQDPKDNSVFVVSLSAGRIRPDAAYSWIDVVESEQCYFHPVGNNWPTLPPNYIGFRYRGRLQSVHHILGNRVVTDLSSINPRWPRTKDNHFVYELGPAMRPANDIRNGKVWPSGRYWCAIDTLLSGEFTTISDARDETIRRLDRC